MTSLSPLAQRIYDVLLRETRVTTHGGYMAAWHISEALGEEIGLCGVPGPGVEAMQELINATLVEEVPDLGCRYQLTVRAWQSLLAVERAARERAEAQAKEAEEDNAVLLGVLREIDYSRSELPPRVQRLLDKIQAAEHPGRALMGELTRRMGKLEREREEAIRARTLAYADFDAMKAEAEELRRMLARMERERDEAKHKAEQYDDVVQALQVADGGRYRNDTIEALLGRLRREQELVQIVREMLSEFSGEMHYIPHDQEQRWRRASGLSEIKG